MKQEIQVQNEATAKIVFDNYLKEVEKFNVKTIMEVNSELCESQKGGLKLSLKLGRLLSIAINEFKSDEAKQRRKNLGLKVSTEYFFLNAYGFSKSWACKLIKAYELGEDVHREYMNSGNTDKEISIAGLLNFANKGEEATEEATEEVTEEATEEAKVQKFGGVQITFEGAKDVDILAAIAYLQSLVK